ncbi:MAG: helicase HerA domain-containing protein [Candidatus Nanohalobium sp.]
MSNEAIQPTITGEDFPVVELLTGRGFITGKSGSGKSNTAGVIMEELLEDGYPLLVIDTEGEYYGLKEQFEILHVGADENCDVEITPEHADKITDLALKQNVPVVLDVSGYLDEEDAKEMVRETVQKLFNKEKKMKKPFLLVIEECHEYIPEKVQLDETGQAIIKVAKRGRKRGLGVLGISQRPANVKKDFITQANYKIWHQLDWDNDLDVVKRVLNKDAKEDVKNLEIGEALIDADFFDGVIRTKFKERKTFHAGRTPTLEDFDRPELKEVSEDLVEELNEISEEKEQEENRIEELENTLERKNQRVKELEERVDELREHNSFAERFVNAIESKVSDKDSSEEIQEVELEGDISGVQLLEDSIIEEKLDRILDEIESLKNEAQSEVSAGEIDEKNEEEKVELDDEQLVEELQKVSESSRAGKKAVVRTALLLKDEKYTVSEISNHIDKSEDTARRAVRSLKNKGLVNKVGTEDRKSVYSLSEDAFEKLARKKEDRERTQALVEKM